MLKAIAFGLAVGAGVQAWRAWPPSYPVSGAALALAFAVGVIAAYLGGRWHGRPMASAWASAHAHAEATATAQQAQTVNVAVVMPGAGAGNAPCAVTVPTENASWIQGAREHLAVDQLDGMDLSELLEQTEQETTT